LILAIAVAVLVLINLAFAYETVRAAVRPASIVNGTAGTTALPALSIVVPARDEERQIETCVRLLLGQRHDDFEVIVVDDRSSDATPEILAKLASEDARLIVVRGEPLPEGWVGKPWALVQGARRARGSWLLFTDADTFHTPLSAASAQRAATARNLDVLSLITEQEVVTLAERALMPSVFLGILLGTGPVEDVGNPAKPGVALFNGQYILFARHAYDAIGGHACVAGEIAEDLELSRRLKRDGRFRIALCGSRDVASTRMYRSLREVWSGFVKNFALGLRGEPLRAAAGIAGYACLSPVSPVLLAVLAIAHAWNLAAALGAAIALTIAAAVWSMRRMRLPPWSGLWLPVGNAFVVAVVLTSMARFASGRGVEWRGRRYDGSFGSS